MTWDNGNLIVKRKLPYRRSTELDGFIIEDAKREAALELFNKLYSEIGKIKYVVNISERFYDGSLISRFYEIKCELYGVQVKTLEEYEIEYCDMEYPCGGIWEIDNIMYEHRMEQFRQNLEVQE